MIAPVFSAPYSFSIADSQTESVCAGALHIQLGGDASYFGKIVKKAAFGDPMRRVDRTDILAAVDLMTAASVLAVVLLCAIRLTI